MKKIGLFLISFLLLFIPRVFALEDNLVNIYFFHSDSCAHCAQEKELLSKLEKKYNNIRIYMYEVGTDNNMELLEEVGKLLEVEVSGVPFTVIGNKVFKGFSYTYTKSNFMGAIDYYSKYGYVDKVGEYLGIEELGKYEVMGNEPDIDEYIEEYIEVKVDIPFIGPVDLKNIALPGVAAIIGFVDGFNPCAMWVLLFLISMLIGMKDRKKMFILGTTFLLSSALVYLLFMVAWLNAASFLTKVFWVRLFIGILALCGSGFNIYGYFKERKTNGCVVVNDKKRNKIFNRIKKFTSEKNFFLAIIGIIALAFSVNIVELVCSAGLPMMFSSILAMNNISLFDEILYFIIYMFFFLIDDMIIFIIAMSTMQVSGISTKYGKISKIVGGILMFIIGILLILKPEWIMFNF